MNVIGHIAAGKGKRRGGRVPTTSTDLGMNQPYLELQNLGDRPYAAHVQNTSRNPIAMNNCCTEPSVTLMHLKSSPSRSCVNANPIVLSDKVE